MIDEHEAARMAAELSQGYGVAPPDHGAPPERSGAVLGCPPIQP
jgi:hypothetical protein